MRLEMTTRTLVTIAIVLVLIANTWAVSLAGETAHYFVRSSGSSTQNRASFIPEMSAELSTRSPSAKEPLPGVVRFRDVEGRGLLVQAWVNGVGVYTFAIDTGAGATIISERVASEARVPIVRGSIVNISGLGGITAYTGRAAIVRRLAIGWAGNLLPSGGEVIVTDRLPPDVDGVLDPTESYWPLGYVIDMPEREIRAFNPDTNPLRLGIAPPGGVVVPWLVKSGSRRPFVDLNIGRRALLDTGSGFGLALSENAASAIGIRNDVGRRRDGVRDLGGAIFSARRVAPATVFIGALELRRVPTDLLSGVGSDAPILLGREALQPFRLTFDPLNQLIQIVPR